MNLPEPIFTPTTLEVVYRFKAPPAEVFRAWTEPEKLAKWFRPSPEGREAQAEVDLRVGGRYRLGVPSSKGDVYTVGGEYKEIQPPHRLVFTWGWELAADDIPETLITLEFLDKDGGTELHLRHEGFVNEEERDSHAVGWQGCAENLYKLLGEA